MLQTSIVALTVGGMLLTYIVALTVSGRMLLTSIVALARLAVVVCCRRTSSRSPRRVLLTSIVALAARGVARWYAADVYRRAHRGCFFASGLAWTT